MKIEPSRVTSVYPVLSVSSLRNIISTRPSWGHIIEEKSRKYVQGVDTYQCAC